MIGWYQPWERTSKLAAFLWHFDDRCTQPWAWNPLVGLLCCVLHGLLFLWSPDWTSVQISVLNGDLYRLNQRVAHRHSRILRWIWIVLRSVESGAEFRYSWAQAAGSSTGTAHEMRSALDCVSFIMVVHLDSFHYHSCMVSTFSQHQSCRTCQRNQVAVSELPWCRQALCRLAEWKTSRAPWGCADDVCYSLMVTISWSWNWWDMMRPYSPADWGKPVRKLFE